MQPSDESPDSQTQLSRTSNRRFIIAMLTYAALAALAAARLNGRPRLVVWLFLGLFAFKTLLSVLRRDTD